MELIHPGDYPMKWKMVTVHWYHEHLIQYHKKLRMSSQVLLNFFKQPGMTKWVGGIIKKFQKGCKFFQFYFKVGKTLKNVVFSIKTSI
jgi:hypothetical protein